MREITLSEFDRTEAAVAGAAEAFHMDEESFRDFYERTARPLCAYLSRVLRDPPLAEDLMQEAYYRFLRADIPDMGEAHRRNYLFRIATNLLRDHWRKSKNDHTHIPDGMEIAAHDRAVETIQHQSVLARCLDGLTPRERELIWLAYAQGSSHKEIAEILGLKAGSIRLLLFRARKKLATYLRRQGLARNQDETRVVT